MMLIQILTNETFRGGPVKNLEGPKDPSHKKAKDIFDLLKCGAHPNPEQGVKMIETYLKDSVTLFCVLGIKPSELQILRRKAVLVG